MKTVAFKHRYWIRWVVIFGAWVLIMPQPNLPAAQSRRSRHARRTTVHRHRRRRHYRRRQYRRRYAHLHLSHKRALQIQEALVKAGFLHDKPDGIWGPTSRAAMRDYQKANGFTPTGLPEAKPLMKLGLGPHPLPPGLEPLAPTEAKNQTPPQGGTMSSSTASQKSSSTSAQ